MLLAYHHPAAVKALLLWRVTGGPFAARRLAFNYYEQFLQAVETGGIAAVLATEHFAAVIAAKPVNAETPRHLGAAAVTAAMRRWLAGFRADRDFPVAGQAPEKKRTMTVPALIIPGNDRVPPPEPVQAAHRLQANATCQTVLTEQVDADVDFAGWDQATGTLAARFINDPRAQERR